MRDFDDEKDCDIRGFIAENNTLHTINDLIALNIKLLNTIIEANNNLDVYKKMGEKISFSLLIKKLRLYYNEFEGQFAKYKTKNGFELLPKNAFKGKISEAFNIMIFIRMIDDHTKIYST